MMKIGGESSVERYLEAQSGPLGLDEAIRQIMTGNISGDWVVWTFPCQESKLKIILWLQNGFGCGDESRFRQLKQYALAGRRDAEAYIFHPILMANFERICTVLYERDRDYVCNILERWMSMLWSSLSAFEYLSVSSNFASADFRK